jgi:hypothetical protein
MPLHNKEQRTNTWPNITSYTDSDDYTTSMISTTLETRQLLVFHGYLNTKNNRIRDMAS